MSNAHQYPYLVPFLYTAGTLMVAVSILWLINIASELFDKTTTLTREQAARLALAAPYFAIHFFSYDTLQGKRPFARQWIRCLLYLDWDIRSRASALETLDWLAAAGSRFGYGTAKYAAQSSSRGEIFSVPWCDEFRPLLAWDIMRLVFVARCCACVGLIEPAELWHYVDKSGQLARCYFATWGEWSEAFLRGRQLWTGDVNVGYRQVVKRLLSAPQSVWNRVKWTDAIGRKQSKDDYADLRAAAD